MAHQDHKPEKAQPLGLATLDALGKVPTATQIDFGTLVGQLVRVISAGGTPALPTLSGENLTDLPLGGGADPPGVKSFGSILNYPLKAGNSASEIQYCRVPLTAGKTYDRMTVFIAGGGSGSRNVRLGVYDQADPNSFSADPQNRIAQTASFSTDVPDGTFLAANLAGVLTVPTTGQYWLALIANSSSIKFNVTANAYRAGMLPVRRQSGATTVLPATASGLTNPTSAVIYVALVEQGVSI